MSLGHLGVSACISVSIHQCLFSGGTSVWSSCEPWFYASYWTSKDYLWATHLSGWSQRTLFSHFKQMAACEWHSNQRPLLFQVTFHATMVRV